MKIEFLGTGTSTGIPQLGCQCEVCLSTDSRDARLRASVLLSDAHQQVLIDCGPDFRQQALACGLTHLDAILLTHEHYDHVGGLDDIRPLGDAHVYAESRVLEAIQRVMPYCFTEQKYKGVPEIRLHQVTSESFRVGSWEVQPIRVWHGKLPIVGYRIGNFAYLTDVKSLRSDAIKQLCGLDMLIINALRTEVHPTHISLAEAIELAREIGSKQVFFTHFSHQIGLHAQVDPGLPCNMQLAYDGLVLNVE